MRMINRILVWLLTIFVGFQGTAFGNEVLRLNAEEIQVEIETSGVRFGISDGTGSTVAPMHATSGIRYGAPAGEGLANASIETVLERSETELRARLVNSDGGPMEARFSVERGVLRVELSGDPESEYTIDIRTAPMGPVYGLGDHGGYGKNANLFGFRDEKFVNTGNKRRFISTFAIFPKQGLGQVLFENGLKRVSIDETENRMGVDGASRLLAYYFVGEPPAVYREYKGAREREGYLDYRPKFTFFELGYEAFGSLGWNTFQDSVEKDIADYLERGYDLRWAVVGSGFWKGERANPAEGSTVSFGMWDDEQEPGRKDSFPNPRYPRVEDFKTFFREREIQLLLGSRINFKARPEEGGNYNLTNDGPYVVEGLARGYFISKEEEVQRYRVTFPKGKVYLLNAENPDAVEWYLEGYQKWDVDGVKEDLMLLDGVRLRNDARVNRVNEALMRAGYLVMVRNGAFSVAGDILRLEDTKHGFDQDRPVINLLAYAASGYSNAYPDIVAGKYLQPPLSDDEKIYFVRNAMFAAVTPGMSFGIGPWHLEPAGEEIVKKAADLHQSLAPYIYSEVIRNFETGYPHALTPLPIAFPRDAETYDLASVEKRQYSWLIGKSLLATPLYGEDYATAVSRDVYLPEGRWMDWETGEILEGGRTYRDYPFPPEKVPLFIGGDGLLVLRREGRLYGYYFPLNERAAELAFTFPGGERTTIAVSGGSGGQYSAVSEGGTVELEYDPLRRGYAFPLAPGQRYEITAR